MLDEGVIDKIDEEAKRNGLSRSKFLVKCIEEHLYRPKEKESESLIVELEHLKEVLKLREEQIKMQESQLGFLQQQYSLITQRMLEPPEKIKRRWKFWKK
jgi:hypothetical protein